LIICRRSTGIVNPVKGKMGPSVHNDAGWNGSREKKQERENRMFGNNYTLFTFMGFRVRANVSWLFLALLVMWSLAAGFFPAVYPGLPTGTYWAMGLAGMTGLFFSLLFHEFSHSLEARRRGMKISGITLFLFGGVAEMQAEPPDPKSEFWIAIVGPASSVLLAGIFYAIAVAMETQGLPAHIFGVAWYLAFINVILAAFNMVPGYPLDGGRILRAALWGWKGDIRWATRWASGVGQAFGLVLVGLGILAVLAGNIVGGMWWFLIGLFVRGAASAAYQQLLVQQAFQGENVRRFMAQEPVTVPPETSIHEFIENYLYKYDYDVFPITRDERLVGCASLRQAKTVPRERWNEVRVGDICEACGDANTVDATTDASDALTKMQQNHNGRLMVTERNRLVGVLTLKDLLRYLQMRTELEGT
jgi:Zn-dependent protease/CBS domain-containing protein